MKKVLMIMLAVAFMSAGSAIAQDKKSDCCPKQKTECSKKKDCPKDCPKECPKTKTECPKKDCSKTKCEGQKTKK